MNRRDFIVKSLYAAGGGVAVALSSSAVAAAGQRMLLSGEKGGDSFTLFRNPPAGYRPFVRWWWNGNKVQPGELIRELRLLKDAGIGGVEINPVKFPEHTDDLGAKALTWLSDEWIDALKAALDEAKQLGMTCDLIVGSGWPFGGKFLKDEERAQIMVIGVKKLEGPMLYETSVFALLKDADPRISASYSGRLPHLLSLRLAPDPMGSLSEETDLSGLLKEGREVLQIRIPKGKHALYSLVRIDAFGEVINGAPGADGPTLNHFDREAVTKYLNHMSSAIEGRIGPLSGYLRALFTDSMELEGANWTGDMAEAFARRRGYDVMPYLPYLMFKTEGMGNVSDYNYGVGMSPEFRDMIERMRFDMETTKAELLLERFTGTYVEWCHGLNVKSRAQAYGRGFFPLETSMAHDIPEGESWTTNYLQHRIGEEMSNEDYRRGRSYTMVNKYVSSAAHLAGKRLVSAEEMTNTYRVFNMTLEFLKIGCDMNAIAGITHSVFHGFNYSPAEAPFPGWIRYGAYYNEKNNWWPYFKYFNDYRARVSSMLQNADMYADIAILPPVNDMWTTIGMQNEPFPSAITAPYTSLLWEAMHKTGNGADYVSESILIHSTVEKGWLRYGGRKYSSLFLIETERMYPATLAKLYDFVASGGRVLCVEKYPAKSLGWKDHERNDREVGEWMQKLRAFPDRFALLTKPEDNDFMAWYPAVQQKYRLTPFVAIENPHPYVMANRYIRDDGSEFFFFINAHLHREHQTIVRFPKQITARRYGWVWNPEDGKRYRIYLDKSGAFPLYLGPADSRIIVFDGTAEPGEAWKPLPVSGANSRTLDGWDVELRHSGKDFTEKTHFFVLDDLKNTPYIDFTGTVVYARKFYLDTLPAHTAVLNLGKVWGVAEVKVNGKECGVSWYGNRLYNLSGKLKTGENELEVKVITTMGNYVQTLKGENKIAEKWTARPGRAPQPKQSMGMAGPVTLYETEGN
ncbi:MAG: glycoside hydrolase family 2 [Prevotellaceae bacterium]|jgi:hypothetical protein|nr:glycoside hydrolase family 2 [Prevotellaceae bacterium]